MSATSRRPRLQLSLAFVILFLALVSRATAQQLVVNGTFDLLSTTGWTIVGGYGGYVHERGSAQGGSGDWISIGGSLSQVVPTVAGQRYLLSFAARGDDPGQSFRMATLRVWWAGQLIASYTWPNYVTWNYPKFLVTAAGPSELRFETINMFQHPELDDISVVPAPNTQPDITLTSPLSGAAYVMGSTVPLSVSVTPGVGAVITNVEYFHTGATLIAATATAPFNAAWTNVPPGSWLISARVRDNAGHITTAALRSINVAVRPTVYWTSPAEGVVLDAGSNVELTAVVTNNDGRIQRFEVRVDDAPVRVVTAPVTNGIYRVTWPAIQRGNYRINAIGLDSSNLVFSADERLVTVLPPAVLDQTQTYSSSTVTLRTNDLYAQTFRPAVDGELHHIELNLFPNHYAETFPVDVRIVETALGAPTGALLATASVRQTSQDGVPVRAYMTSVPPVLRAGVLYAFIISAPQHNSGLTLRTSWEGDHYAAGAIWRKLTGGDWERAEREPNFEADVVFNTYMIPHTAPVATLTSPTAGAQFRAGANVQLTANVVDPESDNITVQFHAGGILIGETSQFPYTITWSNVPAGQFPIVATARDNVLGLAGSSEAVAIEIIPADSRPSVSARDAQILEGAINKRNLTLAFELSAPATNDVKVTYATADGTAKAGDDYAPVSGWVTIPKGATNTAIYIPVFGDRTDEPYEFFFVNVLSVEGANIGRAQAKAVIVDDEPGAGKPHHFEFSTITSPQETNRPFYITVSALDLFNQAVTNFSGRVRLSIVPAPQDNGFTLFNGIGHTRSTNTGTSTVGYWFTPKTNLLVTGVRHYAGYAMSLWSSDGTLIFRQNLPATAGSWVDTTLSSPISLKAGSAYSLSFFAGLEWYGITNPPAFAHGVVGSPYVAPGDTPPGSNAAPFFPFADLRYRLDAPVPTIIPTELTPFAKGRWAGGVTLTATNFPDLQIRAEDEFGHVGLSQVFSMNRPPSVAFTAPADGDSFRAKESITIEASATDSDGEVVRVEFFADGKLLGAVHSGAKSMEWRNPPLGDHVLTLRATDNLGATSTESTRVHILAPPEVVARIRFDPPSIPNGSRSMTQWNERGFLFSSGSMGHTDSTAANFTPRSEGAFLQAGTIALTRPDQQPFSLLSVDLAEYSTVFQNPLSVSVLGTFADGQTVNCVFETDGQIDGVGVLEDFETFRFPPSFTNLVRADFTAPFNLFSMDNLRVSTAIPNSPALHLTSPQSNAIVAVDEIILAAQAAGGTDTVSRVDFYIDNEFIGSAFDAPFTIVWPYLTAGAHTLNAIAHTDTALEIASDFFAFTVTERPRVFIANPTNGFTLNSGEQFAIQAEAHDGDGVVASVTFYDGTNFLGVVTNAPFWLTWSNIAAGAHHLLAVARDDLDVTGVSTQAVVIANAPPKVTLLEPQSGAVLGIGDTLHLLADAIDTDGTISAVEFFAGTNRIGRVETPPYAADWISTAAGPFCITAVAVDDRGARASQHLAGRVNHAPSIAFDSAITTIFSPANVIITGRASDFDGEITRIVISAGDQFAQTQELNRANSLRLFDCDAANTWLDAEAPFTATWSNVPPGVHTIRAFAVDSDGTASAISERTIVALTGPLISTGWVATNEVRGARVRFIQRVTINNPTGTALDSGELIITLDRASILRGVRIIGAKQVRRGVWKLSLPHMGAASEGTIDLPYAAPNRRKLPQPALNARL